MIINSKADYDNAPDAIKDKFKADLAASIYSWDWVDDEWVLKKSDELIKSFGLKFKDFKDIPKPEKPDYNPDEQAAAKRSLEVELNRKAAYFAEADPLFFQVQRGEIGEQVWFDKIEEIKQRFPK